MQKQKEDPAVGNLAQLRAILSNRLLRDSLRYKRFFSADRANKRIDTVASSQQLRPPTRSQRASPAQTGTASLQRRKTTLLSTNHGRGLRLGALVRFRMSTPCSSDDEKESNKPDRKPARLSFEDGVKPIYNDNAPAAKGRLSRHSLHPQPDMGRFIIEEGPFTIGKRLSFVQVERISANGDSPLPQIDRLLFIVAELIACEQTYVHSLQLLHGRLFNIELINTVPEAQTRRLLTEVGTDIAAIASFHQDNMLENFYSFDKMWPIVDVLQLWQGLDSLDDVSVHYTSYYQNYEDLVEVLSQEIERNKEISTEIDQMQSQTDVKKMLHGLSVVQTLIRPVQQLPRYKIFIGRIIKHLSKMEAENPQYVSDSCLEGLAAKNALLHAMIGNFNRSIGLGYCDVLQLQERVSNSIAKLFLDPNRKVIMHGEVEKINSRDGEMSNRYFVLFSDLLLVCSSSIYLGSSSKLDIVHQILPISEAVNVEQMGENCTSILRMHFKLRVIDFYSREKDQWMDALVSCGVTLGPPSFMMQLGCRAPVWERDDFVSACPLCECKFRTIYRRHHCRACGRVVCGTCSRERYKLEYTGNDNEARVCDECASKLDENKYSDDWTESF